VHNKILPYVGPHRFDTFWLAMAELRRENRRRLLKAEPILNRVNSKLG